ncbi:synaptic vesicular amine transporter-like, partial [Sitophilus oryzae]|uniref:Synaptic vesicular amine transporter-like n=1 Tax=Sitophilus oryzae TaxID=7048 RepID=A0A6J2XDV8_SITOR
PIIPEFLYDINHPEAPLDGVPRITTTTAAPTKEPPCEKYIKLLSKQDPEFNASLYATTTSTYENLTQLELSEKEQKHKYLVQETVEVGMLFASKAFVQLVTNPFVGPLTH